ncbi:MAG: hypothetical protein ACHQ1D_00580 [Nitrososphaerales archaeon]
MYSILLSLILSQFNLGAYWAGSSLGQPVDWVRAETQLAQLAKDGFNCVWITDLDAKDGAKFSSIAAKYKIKVACRPNEITLNTDSVLNGDHKKSIEKVLADWGTAPKPIWVMGDELKLEIMPQVSNFLVEWYKQTPSNIITVSDWSSIEYFELSQPLCLDVYPFGSSYPTSEHNAYLSLCRYNARLGDSWVMCQGFDEPGRLRPTNAQLNWQVWGALMCGAKGLFCFSYPSGGSVNGLLNKDWSPTPLYAQLSKTYKEVRKYTNLRPTDRYSCIRGSPSCYSVGLTDGANHYIGVLAGYETDQELTLEVGPEILLLVDEHVIFARNGKVRLPMKAGEVKILKAFLNKNWVPKYKDLMYVKPITSTGVIPYENRLCGRGYTALDGDAWPLNSMTFDLGKSSRHIVKYRGWAEPSDNRGVQIWTSDDNINFTLVSQNQFGVGIDVEQYLKVSIAWPEASPAYGWLSDLEVWSYR